MLTSDAYSSAASHSSEAKRDNAILSTLNLFCDKYGLANATHLGFKCAITNLGRDTLVTTYSKSWIDKYNKRGYQKIDPVAAAGRRSHLPVDWSDIAVKSDKQKRFWNDAQDQGIGQSGLVVSVRGPQGDSSLFSVSSRENGKSWLGQKRKLLPEFTHMAHSLHAKMRNHVALCSIRLAKRERQVLFWAAHGKTAWETAKILDLAEGSVVFYTARACRKLGAKNKIQAVATAVSLGMLSAD